jgi:hypothetical protein
VSPVKFKLGFYIPEDDILHSDCHENLRSYIDLLYFVTKSQGLDAGLNCCFIKICF